jgi:flavin-dependent dehydrogenase
MAEVTIVGAGVSGLVASINLARSGHDVHILEAEKRIGGMPKFRPDPAGSPFDIEAIKNYTGVDITPAVRLIDESYVYAWGRRFYMPMKASTGMYMVERGSRATSLDSLLLAEAQGLGVEVEFEHQVLTQGDFARLPADTIVATGLKIEPYEALSIPYSPLNGFFAKGTVDHDRTTVSLWMDDFTKDYAFNSTINGICFALLFQRDIPLSRAGKEKFVEMLAEREGVTFTEWSDLYGAACPVGSVRNPRLFHGNKIISGTLAGVIDPFLFFGMLGALVSGKIAAKAIDDKAEAYDDFRRAIITYYPNYLFKRVFNLVPDFIKKPLVWAGLSMVPKVEDFAIKRFARNIPGWRLSARP